MAFFLGTETCVESLSNDLKDIQQTIDEVLSLNGPIKCYSWKSPDKQAIDLNIEDLINVYKYDKNNDISNQIAHYSLLELIIDRLLLLIYFSSIIAESSLNSSQNDNKIIRLNAGLTVKKYWNKFSQLNLTIRQLNNQSKSSNLKKTSNDDMKSSRILQNPISNVKPNTKGSQVQNNVSNEVSCKGCQTNETAFVPCASCAKIQKNLQKNADQLINICHFQNIISNVGKFRSNLISNQLVGGWLNGDDLEKWLNEQDKDLNRISQELEFLNKNNQLLKTKLNENEIGINNMLNNEKDFKKAVKEEQEIRKTTVKQYEQKILELSKDYESKIDKLMNDIRISLCDCEKLKLINENNDKLIKELRTSNELLNEDLKLKNNLNEKIRQIEEEKIIFSTEIDCLKRELIEKSKELNNERNKFDGLIRSEQSLKLKYESLLNSLDKLSVENDQFKSENFKTNEEKNKLMDEIRLKNQNIDELKSENKMLNNLIDNLKSEIRKLKENQTLLLQYPDLYGPIEQLDSNETNVCEEMDNQINANEYRIHLLENINAKLRNSINKLKQSKGSQIISEKNIQFLNVKETEPDNCEEFSNHRHELELDLENLNLSSFRKNSKTNSFCRPAPLFKLENEIESDSKNLSKESPRLIKKYLSTEGSIVSDSYNNITSFSEKKNYQAHLSDEENLDIDISDENDDDSNFFKKKQASDQDYLNKLNQIVNTSELKIENSDFHMYSFKHNRRDNHGSFLYNPSTSSLSSDRNNSRVSNYSALFNKSNTNKAIPNIPPAEKNMEVVVGKGRRVSSALGSSRATYNKTNPINSKSKTLNSKDNIFKCKYCEKSYNNIKDFDIHKLYCNLKK